MSRILVIERDAKIRDLLTRFLGVKGYDVTATVDGASGMDCFIAERPDLMLVDLQLPDMSGIELCRAVRDTRLDVSLVLMGTARQARKPAVEEAREALEIPLFLIKPFGVDALMAAIAQGLATQGERRGSGAGSSAPRAVTPAPRPEPALVEPAPPEPAPPEPAPAAHRAKPSSGPPPRREPPSGAPRARTSDPPGPIDTLDQIEAITAEQDLDALDALEALDAFDADDEPTDVGAGILRGRGEPRAGRRSAPPPAAEGDPAESYGASTAGGLLAGRSMAYATPPVLQDDDPAASHMDAVYPVEGGADAHTWGVDSLRMEAIRHGPSPLQDDERRYALQPIVPDNPSDPRGIYGAITVPNLLYRCFRDLFTGQLVIRRGPVRKTITLANGRPIGAESNIRSETLGYLLMQDGIIDQSQLQQSVRIARQLDVRQGEALVRIGAIDADALADGLRRQLRGRVLSCFSWSGAEYGLTYEPDVGARVEPIELNPLVLIFDGIKTSFPVAPLVAHFDERNRSPARATERLRDYATMLRDFADELRVAALCDGQRTLGEVLARSPYGLVDTLRILRALEITGCLVFGNQQAVGAVSDRPGSPRAAIGGSLDGSVGGSMSGSRSISGGRRPVRRPPERPSLSGRSTIDISVGGRTDDSIDREGERRRSRRREPVRRAETGPDLIKADANFAKGRRCLENDDLENALAHFQLACKQDPHQSLFKMYRGWTRFLLAPPTDRRARAEAHDEIKAALDADSNQDEGYVLLGNVYRELGKEDAALRLYRKALSLNRRNPQANRAIRELEGRRTLEERDPQGLFGKFFTRR